MAEGAEGSCCAGEEQEHRDEEEEDRAGPGKDKDRAELGEEVEDCAGFAEGVIVGQSHRPKKGQKHEVIRRFFLGERFHIP